MPVNTAALRAAGSLPEIEIIVGFAHFAKFEFFLYDQAGQNPVKFADGDNSDDTPDIFEIGTGGTVAALDKRTVFWQAAIASPTGTPGENYSVLIRILQDGQIVGTDGKTGPMTDPLPHGFIRLTVQ
ncbi:MAG: hypothetical protein AB1631_14145 [Acidobacteriota bacterium]